MVDYGYWVCHSIGVVKNVYQFLKKCFPDGAVKVCKKCSPIAQNVLGKMFQQAAQNQMRKKIHGFLQSILYVFYMY